MINTDLLDYNFDNTVSAHFFCDSWPSLDLFEDPTFQEGCSVEYREDLQTLRVDAPTTEQLQAIVNSDNWPKGLQQIFPVLD
mgnify:CR=1 FL=1